jgi:DNA-binding LacI/PurR family transcriptional regulator
VIECSGGIFSEAQAQGVHLQLVAAQGPSEFDQAFSTIAAKRADAFIAFPSIGVLIFPRIIHIPRRQTAGR